MTVTVTNAARAQGALAQLRLQPPAGSTPATAFTCAVGAEARLILQGVDSGGRLIALDRWAPTARSSNERVVGARILAGSPGIVVARCSADGQVEITAQAGALVARLPVYVGTARPVLTALARTVAAPTTMTTAARAATPTGTALTSTLGTRASGIAAPAGVASGPTTLAGATYRSSASTALVALPASARLTKATLATLRVPTDFGSEPAAVPAAQEPPPPPPVVQPITGLWAYAGYGNVQLNWKLPPGALGVWITRLGEGAVVPVTQGNVLRDTIFFDRAVKAGVPYVYYFQTVYRLPDSTLTAPDAATEPRVVATPRDPQDMNWVPSDWRDPVAVTSVTQERWNATVRWTRKFGIYSYEMFSRISDRTACEYSELAGDYFLYGPLKFHDNDVFGPRPFTEPEQTKDLLPAGRHYCLFIRAVYPAGFGTGPELQDGILSDVTIVRFRWDRGIPVLDPFPAGVTVQPPTGSACITADPANGATPCRTTRGPRDFFKR